MIRSVVVALDGSRFAERALPLAAAVAGRTGAVIRLARVHLPLPFSALPGRFDTVEPERRAGEALAGAPVLVFTGQPTSMRRSWRSTAPGRGEPAAGWRTRSRRYATPGKRGR